MSWGIDFYVHIFLSKQNYCENVFRVQDEIDRLEKECQNIKERMLMLVAGGKSMAHRENCEGNKFDPMETLHTCFCDLLEEYNEKQGVIQNLGYYKEYLEQNNKQD